MMDPGFELRAFGFRIPSYSLTLANLRLQFPKMDMTYRWIAD